jgi:hypothetical protein
MNHTPTPFRVGPIGTEVLADDFVIAFVKGDNTDTRTFEQRQADAAFIVTACNAHDNLVAALRAIAQQECVDDISDYDRRCEMARLAKAALFDLVPFDPE